MLKLFNNFINLLFIFSFFNDNFFVEIFGNIALKALFIIFILSNITYIVSYFIQSIKILKYFYLFIFILFILILVQFLVGTINHLDVVILKVIAIVTIVIYFTFYDIIKSLYFIWSSVLFSIILCYFNEPLTEWTFRKTGGTGDPNEFALHVLVFLILSIYLYTINNNKLFLLTSVLSAFYALLFAASMTSFLVLFIVITLIALKNIKKKKFLSLLLLLLFIIISTFDLIKNDTLNNVISRTDNLGTANTRFDSWKAGYNMFLDNSILGVGINNYSYNTLKYSNVPLSADAIAPHNIFIKLLAESGIIVFIVFILFLSDLFLRKIHIMKESNSIYIFYSVLILFMMSLSIGVIYDNYFWLIIALYLNAKNLKEKELK